MLLMSTSSNDSSKSVDANRALDARLFESIKMKSGSIGLEAMIFGQPGTALRPLIIMHSVEFPVPPSIDFCKAMARLGYRIVFLRRPGFGDSVAMPKLLYSDHLIETGATAAAEAALVVGIIERLELNDAVSLAISSAAPLGYRLAAMTPRISLTILSNPRLNRADWDTSRPAWFRDMLDQIINHRSGIRIAEKGMKLLIRRDTLSFYRQFLKNSDSDLAYLADNQSDFLLAKDLLLEVSSDVIYADTKASVSIDRFLLDNCFSSLSVVALAGSQSTESWRAGLQKEAVRTGAIFQEAPYGDLFCAYSSPSFLASMIEQKAAS